MDYPLVASRAIHFVSTILLSGIVLFRWFVAEPAFRKLGDAEALCRLVRSRLVRLAWATSVIVLGSGIAWFLLQAAQIADLPLSRIFSDATASMVLTQTDFGHVWSIRLVLLAVLAAAVSAFDSERSARLPWRRVSAIALAAALVGTLAWAGHGAAGEGIAGAIHLASDVPHLVAAAAWVGSLVPLVMLVAAAAGRGEPAAALGREVILRFSTLGMISVGTLLATGIINSYFLVGTVGTLFRTDYGRVLLLKVLLFIAMVAVAGINRLILTPRILRAAAGAASGTMRHLVRNAIVEAVLGGMILLVVGVLGMLPPAAE